MLFVLVITFMVILMILLSNKFIFMLTMWQFYSIIPKLFHPINFKLLALLACVIVKSRYKVWELVYYYSLAFYFVYTVIF